MASFTNLIQQKETTDLPQFYFLWNANNNIKNSGLSKLVAVHVQKHLTNPKYLVSDFYIWKNKNTVILKKLLFHNFLCWENTLVWFDSLHWLMRSVKDLHGCSILLKIQTKQVSLQEEKSWDEKNLINYEPQTWLCTFPCFFYFLTKIIHLSAAVNTTDWIKLHTASPRILSFKIGFKTCNLPWFFLIDQSP